MLHRPFGKLGWNVSAIGLGTWNFGNQWGELDDATVWATVRAAVDAGINLVDTAESYGIPNGFSEMRLGLALAGLGLVILLIYLCLRDRLLRRLEDARLPQYC